MSYAAWSVIFGEQPSAAKWNILGTNDAYFDSLVGSGTAWTSWTPILTGITLGNGTLNCKYQQIGKTVYFRFRLVWGSTTSASASANFTLPVTMLSGAYADNDIYAVGTALQTGTAAYVAWGRFSSITSCDAMIGSVGATYLSHGNVTSTVPFTWGNTHILQLTGTYERA